MTLRSCSQVCLLRWCKWRLRTWGYPFTDKAWANSFQGWLGFINFTRCQSCTEHQHDHLTQWGHWRRQTRVKHLLDCSVASAFCYWKLDQPVLIPQLPWNGWYVTFISHRDDTCTIICGTSVWWCHFYFLYFLFLFSCGPSSLYFILMP